MNLETWLTKARDASAPLLAISTPDQPATLAQVVEILGESGPVFSWSCFLGITPANDKGAKDLKRFLGERRNDKGTVAVEPRKPESVTKAEQAFALALTGAQVMKSDGSANLPMVPGLAKNGAVIMLNAPPFVGQELIRSAFLAIRESFKANFRTLILLGQTFDLPAETRDDFACFSVPLPTEAEVEGILAEVYDGTRQSTNGKLPALEGAGRARAKASLLGLKFFAAEQAVAMSLGADGLDQDGLSSRKLEALSALKGCRAPVVTEAYKDVGGLAAFMANLDSYFADPATSPLLVLQMDEFARMVSPAALKGDNTGTAQKFCQHFLNWTSGDGGDKAAELCVGVSGAGKSLLTRAVAGQHGVPCVLLNLGSMEESLLGAALANFQRATSTIDALSPGGRVLILATANEGVPDLPAEVRGRFSSEWFFDLPDEASRAKIWEIWVGKFKLPAQPLPDSEGWTGRDIMQCCKQAKRKRLSLVEVAAKSLTPFCVRGAQQIATLRVEAAREGYLDATRGGPFKPATVNEALANGPKGRKVNIRKLEEN